MDHQVKPEAESAIRDEVAKLCAGFPANTGASWMPSAVTRPSSWPR